MWGYSRMVCLEGPATDTGNPRIQSGTSHYIVAFAHKALAFDTLKLFGLCRDATVVPKLSRSGSTACTTGQAGEEDSVRIRILQMYHNSYALNLMSFGGNICHFIRRSLSERS